MAARVGISNVSYGIGVQNRYSAFLDDEDGFGPIAIAPATVNSIKIRSSENSAPKQKSSTQKPGATGAKPAGRGGLASNFVKQQDTQNKGTAQSNGQRSTKEGDNKRPQQNRRAANNQVSKPSFGNGKTGNFDRDGGNANSRPIRNQLNKNSDHQSNASHQQNKEDNEMNQQQGRPQRNPRFNNRPRQFQNEDKRGGYQQQQHQQQQQQQQPGVQVDGASGFGAQSIEEEKRRRQQKRALDLRFKDPEKREARRQQQQQAEQPGTPSNETGQSQGENFGQRVQRNRRDANGKPDEAGRPFNGPRNRIRRNEGDLDGEQQRDGKNRPGQRDRVQRNRNGFGTGSRTSRNGDDKNQERQKPIPNFSDKSDFPSLVSQ